MMATEVTLPDREVEVIRLLARGMSFPEIAVEMGISVVTVKSYADSARKRLRVSRARLLPQAYLDATGDDPFPS